MTSTPVLENIAPLASTSDVWFLDIWGVLHNGVRPFQSTVEACKAFRHAGGIVILVSNSPRPREGVVRQLDQIGVERDAYDEAITSGDVSRNLIAKHPGETVWHLGPERDRPIFNGLDVVQGTAETGRIIVCTGLFDDERETPDDYKSRLRPLAGRGVEMICANPDVKAERGGHMIYCAGAIAEAYEVMGGAVAYAGKPFAPIYEQAFALAERLTGRTVGKDRVLAIGDGAGTDIEGACRAGVRSIYIASPVSLPRGTALADAGEIVFGQRAAKPIAVMPALVW